MAGDSHHEKGAERGGRGQLYFLSSHWDVVTFVGEEPDSLICPWFYADLTV